ncbi:MAG: hypothetical protein JXX14_14980 [Deltaproteobacteria bacterium]|nr:hypothetical protein [Deltaproteobacteria bacterium]
MAHNEAIGVRWTPLASLIHNNVPWLMARILDYAKKHEYTRYTSTLVEAWRISIEGLNRSLHEGMVRYGDIPEFGAEDTFTDDPLTRFGLIEARRHEERGVSLTLFLGLMKYYRQTYHDLIAEKKTLGIDVGDCRLFLDRCFDRIEIAFCAAWKQNDSADLIEKLASTSRRMTNEKNSYLTLLESLEGAIIVVDAGHLVALNGKANELIDESCRARFTYYRADVDDASLSLGNPHQWWLPNQDLTQLPLEDVFPWIAPFLERNVAEDTIALKRDNATKYYDIRKSAMRDVSEKFTGTVLTLVDVTRRERFKAALQSVLTVHSEMHDEDLTELLPRVLEETARNFESRFTACFLFDELKNDVTVIYCHCADCTNDFQYTVTEMSLVEYVRQLQAVMQGEPACMINQQEILARLEFPELEMRLNRMISATVRQKETLCLVLCAANKAVDYDDFELQHLQFIAENAWNIITRKRAEQVLDQQKNDVERLKRAQSLAVLAGGVAHDFNNLLSVIQSHTRVVGRRTAKMDDEKLQQSIAAILKAVEKGSEVTRTMRACTGTSLGPVTEEELGRMITDWLKQNAHRLPPRIEITTRIQENLPAVKLDRSQFPTVLTNLIENAVDGIGDAAGEIVISLEESESVGSMGMLWTGASIPPQERVVQLCIADNGQGMDDETKASAFDPFFTTKFVGRGLGLAAVRGLVIAHGGRVRIESAPKKGTAVFIEIPTADRISSIPLK